MDRIKDKNDLIKLCHGDHDYIAWSDGGGGEVHRIWDVYFLFEIPQFGGEGRYVGRFYESQIDDLLDIAYSWT